MFKQCVIYSVPLHLACYSISHGLCVSFCWVCRQNSNKRWCEKVCLHHLVNNTPSSAPHQIFIVYDCLCNVEQSLLICMCCLIMKHKVWSERYWFLFVVPPVIKIILYDRSMYWTIKHWQICFCLHFGRRKWHHNWHVVMTQP